MTTGHVGDRADFQEEVGCWAAVALWRSEKRICSAADAVRSKMQHANASSSGQKAQVGVDYGEVSSITFARA